MDKFIDRQRLEAHFSPAITGKDSYTAGEVLLSIQMFPSEDVQPVVHAHKVRAHSQGGGTHWVVCSHCEKPIDWQDAYCKHCGAKMDEEVKK